MFEVTVAGRFRARHQLRNDDGTLEPPHEHEWNVKVCYFGHDLDQRGLLVDFTVLRSWLNHLLNTLDGRHLNEVPAFTRQNPSAENVAAFLAGAIPSDLPSFARLRWVEIEEEPGCVARYYPPGGQD
jgi:6-pyruvoyltetrahydropterin/6-carboxytetrahydropterin synthase